MVQTHLGIASRVGKSFRQWFAPWCFILAGVVLGGNASAAPAACAPRTVAYGGYESLRPYLSGQSVCSIQVKWKHREDVGRCTCWALDPKTLLTAKHCFVLRDADGGVLATVGDVESVHAEFGRLIAQMSPLKFKLQSPIPSPATEATCKGDPNCAEDRDFLLLFFDEKSEEFAQNGKFLKSFEDHRKANESGEQLDPSDIFPIDLTNHYLSRRLPKRNLEGQEIAIVGFSADRQAAMEICPIRNSTPICKIEKGELIAPSFRHDCHVAKGFSGAPIFAGEQLVGMHRASIYDAAGHVSNRGVDAAVYLDDIVAANATIRRIQGEQQKVIERRITAISSGTNRKISPLNTVSGAQSKGSSEADFDKDTIGGLSTPQLEIFKVANSQSKPVQLKHSLSGSQDESGISSDGTKKVVPRWKIKDPGSLSNIGTAKLLEANWPSPKIRELVISGQRCQTNPKNRDDDCNSKLRKRFVFSDVDGGIWWVRTFVEEVTLQPGQGNITRTSITESVATYAGLVPIEVFTQIQDICSGVVSIDRRCVGAPKSLAGLSLKNFDSLPYPGATVKSLYTFQEFRLELDRMLILHEPGKKLDIAHGPDQKEERPQGLPNSDNGRVDVYTKHKCGLLIDVCGKDDQLLRQSLTRLERQQQDKVPEFETPIFDKLGKDALGKIVVFVYENRLIAEQKLAAKPVESAFWYFSEKLGVFVGSTRSLKMDGIEYEEREFVTGFAK